MSSSGYSPVFLPGLFAFAVVLLWITFSLGKTLREKRESAIDSKPLPPELNIHFSRSRLLVPAFLFLCALGFVVSGWVLAAQQPERKMTILAFALAMVVVISSYVLWAYRHFHEFDVTAGRAFIQLTHQGITLLGRSSIPWSAVIQVDLVEVPVKYTKHFLVLRVTPEQQRVLDAAPWRGSIFWPYNGPNQQKLPYDNRACVALEDLTLESREIVLLVQRYWSEAKA